MTLPSTLVQPSITYHAYQDVTNWTDQFVVGLTTPIMDPQQGAALFGKKVISTVAFIGLTLGSLIEAVGRAVLTAGIFVVSLFTNEGGHNAALASRSLDQVYVCVGTTAYSLYSIYMNFVHPTQALHPAIYHRFLV